MLHPLHDRIRGVTMRDVRDVACIVVDAVQGEKPEHQIVAMATLLHLVCERFEVEPRDGMQVAENVLRQARTFDKAHFQGLRDYMRSEL